MHRELSPTEPVLQPKNNLPLFGLTGLLALLMLLDLWPFVAEWLQSRGIEAPSWSARSLLGYRYALLAAILGGARVVYGSLERLLEGKFGADLAMAIACIAAILMNEALIAAEIVFIGLVGECLEGIVFERTRRAVQKLVDIFPIRCWLLRDGQEVRVLTSELRVDDVVLVKPGGKIPVDGIVIEGHSSVNMSALTGESLPVDKSPGEEVLAGSLNQHGALTIRARRVADQTVAGRIIDLTSRALRDKSSMERTADRLARYFLPAVLGLTLLTLLVSLGFRWPAIRAGGLSWASVLPSLYPALSVLVVACPCALILATPAAVIAALGRLAGTGILVKSGAALEQLAGVNAFAFDKTGTLTEGSLELAGLFPHAGVSESELLRLAATAEQQSEHILARLITQEARNRGLLVDDVREFQAHPGAGVVTRTDLGTLFVGTLKFLLQQGISVPPEVVQAVERCDREGQTVLLLALNGSALGVIGIRDRVRPEAAGVVADLRASGISKIVLLTGDRRSAADSVASQTGIAEAQAELLPHEKAAFVENWLVHGKVAMVGDGINDAPALARASVGVAVGGGTDIAAEAGDIILMGRSLASLPFLLRLSRRTVDIIRQNIVVFAFGVNLLGVVITAWLWPLLAPAGPWYEQSPLAAVIYHQFGSLAVLLNAMRLLWFERRLESRSWQSVQQALQRLDAWISRWDVHESWHWLENNWRRALAYVAAVVLVAFGLGGLTRVSPEEVVVVQRFGNPVADLGPGLHWRWPWPIETRQRLQPDRVRLVEIGYRSSAISAGVLDRSWASAHRGAGFESLPAESTMITGDGNLVELQATLRYAIAEPRAFLFSARDIEDILRAVCESVIREGIARQRFTDLLTTGRESFQNRTFLAIQQRCAEYGGLGVRLEGLSLHDIHPPADLVQDYHGVARAMEDRDRQILDAEAAAVRHKGARRAEATDVSSKAQAAAHERQHEAAGAAGEFLARHTAHSSLSYPDRLVLILQASLAICRGQRPESAMADYDNHCRELARRRAVLVEFRLYWDTLTRALAGRDKVLIDAEKLPGRRQLWLMDFDRFLGPMPSPIPDRTSGSRNPRPGGHGEGP